MYSRTSNDDGSLNSRCLYCFVTVASHAETPNEIEHVEARHICPEKALAELLALQHTWEIQTQTK